MIIHSFKPKEQLRPFVKEIWHLNSHGLGEHTERVFPTGHPQVIFHFGTPFTETSGSTTQDQYPVSICGQGLSYSDVTSYHHSEMLGIVFYPHGLSPFLNLPMKEITGQCIEGGIIFPGIVDLMKRMPEHASITQRIAILESFLQIILEKSGKDLSPRLPGIIKFIQSKGGRLKVRDLMDKAFVSERSMQRIFDEYVGLSPSAFISIVRANSAVALLSNGMSFSNLILQKNYP